MKLELSNLLEGNHLDVLYAVVTPFSLKYERLIGIEAPAVWHKFVLPAMRD